jgi:cell wall-associated NlpC family hydrolase
VSLGKHSQTPKHRRPRIATGKTLAASAVVGALGTGLLSAATPAQAALAPSWISGTHGTTVVEKGGHVTIAGTAGAKYRAGARMKVALQLSINGKWNGRGVRTTDRTGHFSFTFSPAQTSQWRIALIGTGWSNQSYSRPLVTHVKSTSARSAQGKAVVAEALRYSGRPYVFGAAGPRAFDCSGLTLYVYKKFGYRLPHSATAQSRFGRAVSTSAMQPGDLVFFGGNGHFSHVGIFAGGHTMVDAPTPGESVGQHRIWSSRIVARRLV